MNSSGHVHSAVREKGPWAYTGPVAQEPYTHENRAAHGNVGFTEVCSCGAERRYLVNGMHREDGVWEEPYDARRERERAQAQARRYVVEFRRRSGDTWQAALVDYTGLPRTREECEEAIAAWRAEDEEWGERHEYRIVEA